MKQCTSCSNTLTMDAIYCDVCNTEQTRGFEEFETKPKYSDVFLKVLCILTIVGAFFTVVSIPFSLTTSTSMGIDFPGYLLFLSVVVALGKLTGAIFMLKKKLTGLYIYTIAAVCSIMMSIYTMSLMLEKMQTPIALISGILSLVFIVAFLVLYWIPINKRVLS